MRAFFTVVAVLLAAFVGGSSGCAVSSGGGRDTTHPRPPNIVLIMADDVGTEAFGCYGGVQYQTPVIDGLASEGVRFSACHAQPLCTPSRVKIMTGKSNARNYAAFSILDRGERTFAHMLSEAGYATGVAGKWQLLGAEHYGDAAGTGTSPGDAGFDEHCLWQVGAQGSRYWDPLIEQNGRAIEKADGRYGPDVFVEFIEGFMESHRDGPFFLYYPMALVHDPFVPTPKSEDRAGKNRAENFADMVEYMDACVGRILAKLDQLGLRENTIVIFLGDNGTGRAITSMTRDGPVRGGKGLTNDRGTRVPLVVSWPGGGVRAGECDDLIDLSDFVPTLAEAAGVQPGWAIDGVSFLPQVRGEAGEPRSSLYGYYNPRPGNPKFPARRWARDDRWKLYSDGRLIDLSVDPEEGRPVGAGEGARAARLKLRAVLDRFPARSPLLRE
jgi:arylsulfatase A